MDLEVGLTMSERLTTLEGWYALHDFRSINWAAWRTSPEADRREAVQELNAWLGEAEAVNDKQGEGSFALYSIVGQKSDILLVHLRETLEDLNELETAFNKLP